jgi:hypothetical protein
MRVVKREAVAFLWLARRVLRGSAGLPDLGAKWPILKKLFFAREVLSPLFATKRIFASSQSRVLAKPLEARAAATVDDSLDGASQQSTPLVQSV